MSSHIERLVYKKDIETMKRAFQTQRVFQPLTKVSALSRP